MHEQDSRITGAKEIYFLKASDGHGQDYPQYNLAGKDVHQLLDLLDDEEAIIGLHGSYYATETKDYAEERKRLEHELPDDVCCHRNHYLRITDTADLQALVNAGFTDDYTLGWADHVGFRFGTTRSAQWINPATLEVTDLTIHPLNIMDCTLSSAKYMHLSEEEAYYTCQQIIDKVRQHGGELTLLWHNSNLTKESYQKQLYKELIDYLAEQ